MELFIYVFINMSVLPKLISKFNQKPLFLKNTEKPRKAWRRIRLETDEDSFYHVKRLTVKPTQFVKVDLVQI